MGLVCDNPKQIKKIQQDDLLRLLYIDITLFFTLSALCL